jgi:uncharacterized protein (DUF952 family)
MDRYVYKITTQDQWASAVAAGCFSGEGIDKLDGFIHLSTASQLSETVSKYFQGQADLLIVRVYAQKLGESLRWEASRGGALFPHLYGVLSLSAVVQTSPVHMDASGQHIVPNESDGLNRT